ncbi:hypothetical protein CIPAW_14G033900 [Carya illinoinensis]|uniref:Uncharacterized protein n=1 Tax=Carya illinoinensis TaxID=32201 RepID=A0A8T1NAH8_CARIL|nr:hypothetical protein CIPAW_14G033900 [Carya illinoinensis]KAG6677608.1 hypothetical protein I3842_14G036300 [Carya illinoinensis]
MSMAFSTSKSLFCFALVFAFATIRIVTAGDEDIISDFVVPTNFTPDDSYFTFTNLRAVVGAPLPTIFKVSKASLAEFPALAGRSVSMRFSNTPLALSIHLTPILAPRSSCFSLVVPWKLGLLILLISSSLRYSKLVTCLYFQWDLFTTSSIVMQIVLPWQSLHLGVYSHYRH